MCKIIIDKILKNDKGVITHLHVIDENLYLGNDAKFLAKKKDLIKMINKSEYDIQVRTIHDVKVSIISNRFFKSYGDKDKNNDLADLPIYKYPIRVRIVNFLKKLFNI